MLVSSSLPPSSSSFFSFFFLSARNQEAPRLKAVALVEPFPRRRAGNVKAASQRGKNGKWNFMDTLLPSSVFLPRDADPPSLCSTRLSVRLESTEFQTSTSQYSPCMRNMYHVHTGISNTYTQTRTHESARRHRQRANCSLSASAFCSLSLSVSVSLRESVHEGEGH